MKLNTPAMSSSYIGQRHDEFETANAAITGPNAGPAKAPELQAAIA
jgi:hypothetical protein